MLDINFIRNNLNLVKTSAREKGYNVDVDKVLELDDSRKEHLQKVEKLRQNRNEIASQMKGGQPSPELIEQGKNIKIELTSLESELEEIENALKSKLKQIPNIILSDVPLGPEENSIELKQWGEKKSEGVDHLDYATARGWVDFERGAKVAGAKFYYLRDELALLENALLNFAIQKVTEFGFHYMIVPDLVSSKILEGCGFNPRTSEQSDEYFIEGEDLALIATAEMPLTGYHMDEIIDEKSLPLCYAGFSACFRKEAGAYGKHTRGLYRVHQFDKLEMYAFCLPEDSEKLHEKILSIEENIWQELNIPYRVINIAAGDLGAPAAKKYDIEYWSPVDQKYRELTSCSNCTDYQARALNIRVRRNDGTVEPVHTLNGTAISLARTLLAVIENYSENYGNINIPEALKPYFNNKTEL